MILDAQLTFDDNAQHLTTEASTDSVDLQEARDIGVGEELFLIVIVDTAFTDASSDSTMTVTIETDDNSGFLSPTTGQTIGTFAALSAAGTRLVAKIDPDAVNERYMQLKYTVANGDLTTGNFSAYIARDIDKRTDYASGFTVS